MALDGNLVGTMCLSHTCIGSRTNAWQVEPKDSLTPALKFGQFGMSNQRFEAITSAIALSTYPCMDNCGLQVY